MIIAGIVFVASVLLQSPKGGGLGLGFGGGNTGGNEYGSKKTMESKLQRTAVVSGILFVLAIVLLPYIKSCDIVLMDWQLLKEL